MHQRHPPPFADARKEQDPEGVTPGPRWLLDVEPCLLLRFPRTNRSRRRFRTGITEKALYQYVHISRYVLVMSLFMLTSCSSLQALQYLREFGRGPLANRYSSMRTMKTRSPSSRTTRTPSRWGATLHPRRGQRCSGTSRNMRTGGISCNGVAELGSIVMALR